MRTYIAISIGQFGGEWGRGKTEEAALAQCRRAGARKTDRTTIYAVDHEPDQDKPYVDDSGALCWFGERMKVAEYVKGKRQEIVAA